MTSAVRIVRRVNGLGLGTMLALVGLWETLVRTGTVEFQFLPAPSGVAGSASRLLASGDMGANVAHTVQVTVLGWVLASALGIGLGLLLGLSGTAWRYSMASIEVVRAIPPVSLVPVALLVFGFSIRMELMIILFVSAWPVLVTTIDGARGVRAELLDVARMLRMSRLVRIRRVVLPAAMPSILVGLRLALSLSLVLAVVAEMIGNPHGLGNALTSAQQALQPEEMFAYVFAIGGLGIALNAVVGYASARLVPSAAGQRSREVRP
ncbi:MAG TPA: ABC transporter permease subunit [Acidimicrobiales bacterium]|nr:ABC transporter permease subunit [Acidimicrobiales bacterium]